MLDDVTLSMLYEYLLKQDELAECAVVDARNRLLRYRYDTVYLVDLIVLQTRFDTVKMISRDISRILRLRN